MKPPAKPPIKNIRFQIWLFQLKSKNFTFFPAPDIEHMVRKFAEKPNDPPKYNKYNMMNPITIPENHHDHACVKIVVILIKLKG